MELSPETCRVKPLRRINAIVASCWNYFTISLSYSCYFLFFSVPVLCMLFSLILNYFTFYLFFIYSFFVPLSFILSLHSLPYSFVLFIFSVPLFSSFCFSFLTLVSVPFVSIPMSPSFSTNFSLFLSLFIYYLLFFF